MNEYNMSPLISIIIPVYNSDKFIEDTLNSIINQDFDDYEIIAIDDGSKDLSGDILDNFAKENDKITVFHIENKGVSNARNTGIMHAKGRYILFIDSDDALDINALQTVSKCIEKADLLIFGFNKVLKTTNQIIHRGYAPCLLNSKDDIRLFIENLRFEDKDIFMNYLWNRVFKRDIILDNKILFDPCINLGEDFVFICEYLKHVERIKIIDEPCYLYFIRGEQSLSQKFNRDELSRRQLMQKSFLSVIDYYRCGQPAYELFSTVEGASALIGIKKIFSRSCKLSLKEKYKYVYQFLDSSSYDHMLVYLRRRKGLKNRIYYVVLKLKLKLLFFLTLNIIK